MKKIAIFLILLSLTGCASNQKTATFENKRECATYKQEIIDEIAAENKFDNPDQDFELLQIFFSPSLNSCLYAHISTVQRPDEVWQWFFIKDFFTKEIVYTSEIIHVNDDNLDKLNQKEMEFNEKINKLKK